MRTKDQRRKVERYSYDGVKSFLQAPLCPCLFSVRPTYISGARSTTALLVCAYLSHDRMHDDYRLTISCMLQYIVQWPQHLPFCLTAVRRDGFLLEYLPESFRRDRQLVLAAVSNAGGSLQFADPALTADKPVVLAAIRNDPFALEHASTGLKSDPAIVMTAIKQDISTLQLADHTLFHQRDFMLSAVALDATALSYAAPELLDSQEFRKAALRANSTSVHYFVDTELFPSLQHHQQPPQEPD